MSRLLTEDAIPTDRVRKAIRYAFLAPDIVRAIVEGRQPVGLTSSYLFALSASRRLGETARPHRNAVSLPAAFASTRFVKRSHLRLLRKTPLDQFEGLANSNSAVRLLLRRDLGVERLLILCAIKRTTRRWPIQGHGLSLEVRVGDSGLLRRLPLHALGWTRQVSLHLPTCNASLRVSLYFGTRRGLEQAFNSLDVAAGDLHHVFREPESGGRGIAAAIAAGPRSRAPKSRCIRVFRFSWKMTVLKIRYTHEKRSCHEQTTPSSHRRAESRAVTPARCGEKASLGGMQRGSNPAEPVLHVAKGAIGWSPYGVFDPSRRRAVRMSWRRRSRASRRGLPARIKSSPR